MITRNHKHKPCRDSTSRYVHNVSGQHGFLRSLEMRTAQRIAARGISVWGGMYLTCLFIEDRATKRYDMRVCLKYKIARAFVDLVCRLVVVIVLHSVDI